MERNTVFIYYLKRLKQIENAGINHVYTCYKMVKVPVPSKLYQSLIDTRKIKGTIITDKIDDLQISTIGDNFVEHELPETIKSK